MEKEDEIEKKKEKKKKISLLKERKNFLKRNIKNLQDLPITLNILEKILRKFYLQMEKIKNLILRVKGNLKVETIDLKNLCLKNIIKREENFKIF